jgi:hypothetical protein
LDTSAPQGQRHFGPAKDVDPIASALERLQTMFLWIEEHSSSFQKLRHTDPAAAETELRYLKDACNQGALHLRRLTDLLLGGGAIDQARKLPKGLNNEIWVRWVDFLQHRKQQRMLLRPHLRRRCNFTSQLLFCEMLVVFDDCGNLALVPAWRELLYAFLPVFAALGFHCTSTLYFEILVLAPPILLCGDKGL